MMFEVLNISKLFAHPVPELGVTPIPTFCAVSIVTAVVPAVAAVIVPPELLTVTLELPLVIALVEVEMVAQVLSPRK